jgi:hypothetical protein
MEDPVIIHALVTSPAIGQFLNRCLPEFVSKVYFGTVNLTQFCEQAATYHIRIDDHE